MSSRERIRAAFDHRVPDRTPIFEYVLLPPMASALLGRPFVDYAGDEEGWQSLASALGWAAALRRYVADRLDLATLLGHDMLYVVPAPPPPTLARPHPRAPGPVLDDPVERIREHNARAEQSLHRDETFLVYELLEVEMSSRGLDLPIMASAYGLGVKTDVELMQCMLLCPEAAHEHFRIARERAEQTVDRYRELGVDIVGVGGDFAGARLNISPEAYRRFIMPEVRAVADRVRAAGMRSANASDGNLWNVIDDFLIGCGVDGYIEIDSRAGMGLARLKSAYGSRITFLGNMDCGEVLSFSPPEEIRRLTLQCLEDGEGEGGHIFCASNAIVASVPVASYCAMVNAYRERFGLPEVNHG